MHARSIGPSLNEQNNTNKKTWFMNLSVLCASGGARVCSGIGIRQGVTSVRLHMYAVTASCERFSRNCCCAMCFPCEGEKKAALL